MAETLSTVAKEIIADHYRPKLLRFLEQGGLGLPLFTEKNRWRPSLEARWSDGFWAGLFWLAWQASGEPVFRESAERICTAMAPRIDDPKANYDLGFLFFYSHVLGYRLTGATAYRETALRAARRLCDFLCAPARVITFTYPERAALYDRSVVTTKIDVMMNLSLLWWAHRESGETTFRDVARGHAERSLDCLLRPDGSVWELADFDPVSGELMSCGKKEGVDGESCWARGQAWAIYGFLQAAHFLGQDRFFEAASRAYDFWRAQLPTDGLPYWDLLAPASAQGSRDSSAAAIVLAALVQAPRWSRRLVRSEAETRMALETLLSALATPEEEGVLGWGCGYFRRQEGMDEATVWGDYYLLEALSGLAGVPMNSSE